MGALPGALLSLVVACSGGTPSEPSTGEGFVLSAPEEALHFVGDTVRVRASGVPDTATVLWRSLSLNLGVDAAGLVTARGHGVGRVQAEWQGATGTLEINVDQVAVSLELGGPAHPLAPRRVVELVGAVVDSGGSPLPHAVVEWRSTNPSVALVDEAGRARGVSRGPVRFLAVSGPFQGEVAAEVSTVRGGGDYRVWSRDGVVLAGTLDLPPGAGGPFPVMVRVHGAGPVDRTSGFFAAQTLLPAGIGLLRYDKRGVGRSGGTYSGVGAATSTILLPLLGQDAAAWLELLAHHEDVEPGGLGLLGVSQGGWINPIAADLSPHARYMINVVGPTVTVGQQLLYQNLTGSTGGGQNHSGLSDQELARRVREFDGIHGFDPAPLLRRLDVPGLWVLGTRDYLVPYTNSTEILDEIVEETGADYSVFTLDGGTHGTRHIATGELIPWWDVEGGAFDWLEERGFHQR